jgi:hypothetical protein
MVSHNYGVFFPNIRLLEEHAGYMAESLNRAGVQYVSFDGLEGCMNSGHSQYAMELFTYTVWKLTKKKPLLCSSSRMSAFFWHMNTHQSWGEPKCAGFRTARGALWEKLTRRIYHERANYIPFRLGYFDFNKIKHITDIEWVLTKGAGFDAGFDLIRITVDGFKQKGQLAHDVMKAIREWEEARLAGFFTDEQKKKFEEYDTVYRLIKKDDGTFETFDISEEAGKIHEENVKNDPWGKYNDNPKAKKLKKK